MTSIHLENGGRTGREHARAAGLDPDSIEYMSRAFEGPEHAELLALAAVG